MDQPGDLRARTELPYGTGELSELARAFDPMAGSMERLITERKQVEEETQRHLQRVTILREINLATTSTLDLHGMLNVLMEKIDLMLPYTAVLLWLFNRETGQLERAACWNLDEREWKGRELTGIPSLIQTAIEGKTPVVARNVQTDARTLDPAFYRKHGLISYLGVPLPVKGEVLGVLVFLTREEHEFSSEEVQFLSTLAGQAAIAIHNSQLYEQTKKQAVELEEANKVQADFAAMIAHDLRAPLTAVISGAAMLEDGLFGPVNEEQKTWLAKIQGNSRNLVDLVSNFLDISKLEAGHIDLLKGEVKLDRLIQDTLDNLLPLAANKTLSYQPCRPGACPHQGRSPPVGAGSRKPLEQRYQVHRRARRGPRRSAPVNWNSVLQGLPSRFAIGDLSKAADAKKKSPVYLRQVAVRWAKQGKTKRVGRGTYQRVQQGKSRSTPASQMKK